MNRIIVKQTVIASPGGAKQSPRLRSLFRALGLLRFARNDDRCGIWNFKFFLLLVSCFLLLSSSAHAMGRRPRTPEIPPEPAAVQPTENPRLTLWDCYELALEQSETVAIQKEEIEEAEAQFFIATGEAVGDVNLLMTQQFQDIQKGGGGSDGSVGSSASDPDRRERRFVINQPLFRGFRALGALMGAGSLKKEQREEWLRAKQLLFLDVARAFYGLLKQKRELETIEGIRLLFEERIQELHGREQIGRSRPSEVATAMARLKTIEADLAKSRGTFKAAQHLLEFLIGTPFDISLLAEEELPNELHDLGVYLETLEERPDVEAARQAMNIAKQAIVVAQSGFWPEISVDHTQYERREGFQSNMDWNLFLTFDIPIFKGGETWGLVKEARSQWKQAKFAHALAKRRAELEVKQAYESWFSSLEEYRALEEALKASQENFRLQKEEYNRNLVGNLDVLSALESLFDTRRQTNATRYQMKENYWSLQVAAGQCCEAGGSSP